MTDALDNTPGAVALRKVGALMLHMPGAERPTDEDYRLADAEVDAQRRDPPPNQRPAAWDGIYDYNDPPDPDEGLEGGRRV
jgi:hypothetical protein